MHARTAGKPIAVKLPVALPAANAQPAVAHLWARKRIGELVSNRRKSHFVVVLEASDRQLLWYDVNRGRRRASLQVFARAWRAYDHGAVVARRCLRRCRAPRR